MGQNTYLQNLEDDTNSEWDNDTSSFLANERSTNANNEEVKDGDAGIIENKHTEFSKQAINTNMLQRYFEISNVLKN